MFNQMFCGVIVKKNDVEEDQYGNFYQEVQFQEINNNKSINGRIVSVRLFNCINVNIYDTIICQNFRLYMSKGDYKYVRLERNWITSQEYVGNEECSYVVSESTFQKMSQLQQNKKKQLLNYYFTKF